MAGFFWVLAGLLPAHEIITTKLTYTRDISRIFARHCIECHGESSSIPLTSYREVRPWAVAIKEQVLARSMPPWGAVKGFRDLTPDNSLSEQEILIISSWVVGGAPQGDPSLLLKESPLPAKPTPAKLHDLLSVATRTMLARPMRIAGIKPRPERPVDSARIVARLPNGRVEPLLWLFRYDLKWRRVFRFREPLDLPPGTIIEASLPLRFILEGFAPKP